MITLFLPFLIPLFFRCNAYSEKEEFCRSLYCQNESQKAVCGIREEGDGYRMRLFENECELLKFGCNVEDKEAYGIINIEYCEQTFLNDSKTNNVAGNRVEEAHHLEKPCVDHNCSHYTEAVCGIRNDGEGFRIRLFENKCKLLMYNCRSDTNFTITDLFICNAIDMTKYNVNNEVNDNFEDEVTDKVKDNVKNVEGELPEEVTDKAKVNGGNAVPNEVNDVVKYVVEDNEPNETKIEVKDEIDVDYKDQVKDGVEDAIDVEVDDKLNEHKGVVNDEDVANNSTNIATRKFSKPMILVDASMFKSKASEDINATIDNFFAATHHLNMSLVDVQNELNYSTRRMKINIFKPQIVFKPFIVVPPNASAINEDYYSLPTMSSCFHKCPKTCPDTYAPVCGSPGEIAREPSLMFQNHCFMDVAQCKMRWEDKSPTAISSNYMEATFIFCLGYRLGTMFRFLPLVRTLQHMGRLKRKGNFRHRLRNLRFNNDILPRGYKLMG